MSTQCNFVLVSRRTSDAFKIRDEIERNQHYSVQIIETATGAMERISKGGIGCLVFNFDSFPKYKTKIIENLRDLGYTFPIIIFSAYVQKEAFALIEKMDRVVIIERPFEAKDVWGICQKITEGTKVFQRVFRRFYTNQAAILEKPLSGETLSGQIYNLSRGGAYLELRSAERVKPGEIFNVTISLDKVSRAYNVNAQVVWATSRGFWQGKPAVGLKFMTTGDVYRNLLDKL